MENQNNKLVQTGTNQITTRAHYDNFTKTLTTLIKNDGSIDTASAFSISQFQSSLTIEKAFESPNRIFNLLVKGQEQLVIESVNSLVYLINAMLNLKDKINEFQAMMIINIIKADYQELTIEEIALCFKWGCSGKYGPIFNRIDVEIICGKWLHTYKNSDERFEYLETRHKREILKTTSYLAEGTIPLDPKISEGLKKLAAELNQIKPVVRNNGPAIVEHVDVLTFSVRLKGKLDNLPLEDLNQMEQQYAKNQPKFYKTALKIIKQYQDKLK